MRTLTFKTLDEGMAKVEKIIKEIKYQVREAGKEMCSKHARRLQLMVPMASMATMRSIRARQINQYKSVVEMLQSGQWVDHSLNRWVTFTKGYRINNWAIKYSHNPTLARMAQMRQGGVYVHNHPFLREAIEKSEKNFDQILKRRINEALSS